MWKKKRNEEEEKEEGTKKNKNQTLFLSIVCRVPFFFLLFFSSFRLVLFVGFDAFLFPLYLYKYLTGNVQSKSHSIPMCTITIDIERNVCYVPDTQQQLNEFVEPFMLCVCEFCFLFFFFVSLEWQKKENESCLFSAALCTDWPATLTKRSCSDYYAMNLSL